MQAVFPEARLSLKDADPEVHGLLRSEMKRQWCVQPRPFRSNIHLSARPACVSGTHINWNYLPSHLVLTLLHDRSVGTCCTKYTVMTRQLVSIRYYILRYQIAVTFCTVHGYDEQ
jgi:hypothetical protein